MAAVGKCPDTGRSIMPYSGAFHCFKQILINEGGFFALYRGMAGLLCFATPRFALIFHGNAIGLKLFADPLNRPNYAQVFAAGAFSQLAVVPLVVAPCERIKVLLQTQPPESSMGQIECLKQVMSKHGFRAGLMRGTILTYARDVPSFATYFVTYEFVKNKIGSPGGLRGVMATLFAGGAAGLAGWSVAIPFDTIKNRHQAALSGSIYHTVAVLWKTAGIAGFFRGSFPILARSMPANAAAFLGYEVVISLLTYCKF